MLLTLKQVKEKFNISRITLLKWEKEGLINPAKTPKGTRRYSQSELEYLLHMNRDGTENDQKDLLLYARVSTRKQLQYLKNQEQRLQEYANSLGKSYVIVSEIASGVNENRRGLNKLLSLVKKGAVKKGSPRKNFRSKKKSTPGKRSQRRGIFAVTARKSAPADSKVG